MGSVTPNPKKRGFLLPKGCKNLADLLDRKKRPTSTFLINGKIRAPKVRVIGLHGQQLGIMTLKEAVELAHSLGVDLVEISPSAEPPICLVVDHGKFRHETSKRRRNHE